MDSHGMKRRQFLQASMGGAMAYALSSGTKGATHMAAAEAAPSRASSGSNSPQPPNILFFFSEHHRWDWVGAHGTVPLNTPVMDRLARDGVMFDECRCNTPLCGPSRAGLATGLRYHRAGVPGNATDLDPAKSTFMKVLRDAGYIVATCCKTDLHNASNLQGIDGWSARAGQLGFTHAIDVCGKREKPQVEGCDEPVEPYMAWIHEQGVADVLCKDIKRRIEQDMDPVGTKKGIATEPFPLERKYQIDDFCGEQARDMLMGFPRNAPWFFQLSFGTAHPPFNAAQSLLDRYEGVEFPAPVNSKDSYTDHQAVRRHYAAMIDGMDEWMGRIIDAVEQRGELDNTIIVFSGDHGEMLGDFGQWNKSRPHEPSVHVPLIVSGPGIQKGVKTKALTELIDLAATFVDLAGLEVPNDWDARSLRPVLEGESEQFREVTVSELGNWRMAFDGRYKYVERPKGEPAELYDLEEDPKEISNVLDAHADVVKRLQAQLKEEIARKG